MMSQEVHKDYKLKDYGLTGANSAAAVESGLADADWYTTPVPRELMRSLHQRKDWPGIRDSVLYFGLILLFGYLTYRFWGEWYALIPMMVYGVLYASASDARWHESSHGSAFRTDWMNNVLYEIASFMVLRESVPWRWSHTRHHSDTIIVGRDPEIAVPRPPSLLKLFLKSFNFQAFRRYFNNLFLHSFGRLTEEEKSFIPEEEAGKVFIRARIYVVLYTALIGSCVYFNTWCMVDADLWLDPACRVSRRCARPSVELPDYQDELCESVPLLEYELPSGASYVPAGSLSPVAQAS